MPPRDPAHDGGQDVGIEGVVAFDRSPTQAPFPRLCSVGATCFGAKNSKKSSAAFPIPTRVPGATDPRVGVIDNGIGSALAPWTLGRIDHLTATQVDAVHGTNVAGILLAGQSANGPAIPPERGGRELHDGAEEMAGSICRRERRWGVATGAVSLLWRSLARHGSGLGRGRRSNLDRHVYSVNPSQITMQ